MNRNTFFVVMGAALFGGAGISHAQGARQIDPMELFEEADTNHDGVVSRDEFIEARSSKFDQLDHNHDGFLSLDDFPRLAKANGSAAQQIRDMLQAADVDHDGRVSREEFRNAPTPAFDVVDVNHDGVVDKDELQNAKERLHEWRNH